MPPVMRRGFVRTALAGAALQTQYLASCGNSAPCRKRAARLEFGLSLFRNIRIAERRTLQVRWEGFNAWNKVNLAVR